MTTGHGAFELLRTESIASLNLTVEEYQHRTTGAQHIHLGSDNPENVFLVALRTVPHDSSGVAHILEHTALCGSEKYPVRDPFFMMTRRSLNTFMNAFTSSDWTAYPFASVNRKDFDNLLNVYLDAVFFSRLDPLDFAQEGHRLEFSEIDNPQSELLFKGVVFNEMKGAMSSVSSILYHTMAKYLHPATTYHFNSGGEPECIPNLSYEQLLMFYKTHYHPSNAIFMTYGDISAAEHQEKFEQLALHRFQRLEEQIAVTDEQRYFSPVRVQESYPLSEEEDNGEKTHLIISWLLGSSADLDEVFTANLIASVLLDNSASPLMHALETTKLGNAPSPLCGLDDSQKELSFTCGLEGCRTESVDEIEKMIFETLEKIAREGIEQQDVEASLHQLELHQREIGGGHYPFGLQLILNALTAATHRGDPVSMLNVDEALQRLREAIKDPQFVPAQIKHLLIDNPHRVRLTLVPDQQMSQRKEEAEKARLARIKSSLSPQQSAAIVANAQALIARQNSVDDASILPKVTLADVPEQEQQVSFSDSSLTQSQQAIRRYPVGSNGLVYQQLILDMPELSRDQLQLMPLYTSCVTEVGVGAKDYMATQKWQAQVCGGFSAFSSLRCAVDNTAQTNQFITFSGKALLRNHDKLCELMSSTLAEVRFDEQARIEEIISQIRASREQSIVGSGSLLAMNAACSGMNSVARLAHEVSGLEGIRRIKTLHNDLKSEPSKLRSFCDSLAGIHQSLAHAPRRHLLIAEAHELDSLEEVYGRYFDTPIDSPAQGWQLPTHQAPINQAWLTNSQVNFCAKAYPSVSLTHPDAAPLSVLANVLRNGFLHRAIREQGGAYGGGAGQDSNNAAFRFYSYRDPRLQETLDDFDRAVDWVLSSDLSWQTIEEAILGIVSNLDKPDSPAGTAKNHFHGELHGRTLALRQAYRERVLATRLEDLKRVAQTYLSPELAHTAVITDHSKRALAESLELDIHVI